MDVLSETLRALRLSGTVYFEADFSAPWGMAMNRGEVANFHIVTAGSCFARTEHEIIELARGDVVVFPHGTAHALVHGPETAPAPAQEVLASMVKAEGGLRYGEGADRTRLICGHFTLDRQLPNPLLATLPAMLVVRLAQEGDPAWIKGATELLVAETRRGAEGSSAIIDRLAEALLMHILRSYADSLEQSAPLRVALHDQAVSQALRKLHEAPAQRWTVAELAAAIGVSRSVLAARFKNALGIGPIQYLSHWRMQRARELLLATSLSLAEVGAAVGYESEYAFAKAFKRTCAIAPGAFRRRGSEQARRA